MVQNSVDALEDAALLGLPSPFLIEVTVNLKQNWISVLDSGIGMSLGDVVKVCAPHASLKPHPDLAKKRDKRSAYRGYKGVGLTFLTYGTDDFVVHSKDKTGLTKARMQYGRAWAENRRSDVPLLVEDPRASMLDKYPRGTVVQFQFSQYTRPKSLSHLASTPETWEAILRTKTAIGQILLEREPLVKLDVQLHVVNEAGTQSRAVLPEYLYPHKIKRSHAFRFLDVPKYYLTHAENSEPPEEKRRQDGLYLV